MCDAEGQVEGFLAGLFLDAATAADCAADPVADAVWRSLRRSAPRKGERVLLFRFWMSRDEHQSVSSVQALVFARTVWDYLSTPDLAVSVLMCAAPHAWAPILHFAGLARAPDGDAMVGETAYEAFAHDWRVVPPDAWLADLAERAPTDVEAPALATPALVVRSRDDFETAVRDPTDARAYVAQIPKHELALVELLRGAIGDTAVTFEDGDFDFTAGGALTPFANYDQFLALAQGFEDTGVRAYKGQAANLINDDDTLTIALRIRSVEARHASYVRRLRGQKGWVEGDGLNGLPEGFGFGAIYAGEATVTQGGVDVATVSSVSTAAVAESFDETLTMDAVLAIADAFVNGDGEEN